MENFENKEIKTKFGWVNVSRIVSSWVTRGGKVSRSLIGSTQFRIWLRSIDVSEEDIESIVDYSGCGKLELEQSAEQFLDGVRIKNLLSDECKFVKNLRERYHNAGYLELWERSEDVFSDDKLSSFYLFSKKRMFGKQIYVFVTSSRNEEGVISELATQELISRGKNASGIKLVARNEFLDGTDSYGNIIHINFKNNKLIANELMTYILTKK